MSENIDTAEAVWRAILSLKYGPNYQHLVQNVPHTRMSQQLARERATDWIQVVQGTCDVALMRARKKTVVLNLLLKYRLSVKLQFVN